uniref:GTP-dependent nucleic acid-binding protein engD n=1 Tax=Cajanus cajan TaxID=3821 RepID=A0A151QZN3_CAJCA|nr:GTP-dependent nucleic acid-binding protein engD [Cajanus cajan]
MSLRAGIVGLPNVGKSTLFNAVVENGKAQAANFPFCTIEPNVGIVAVPDSRLHVLSDLSKSQRAVPASIEFVDIAGLVKGASQGEGLGNKFLSHIREVDSILQVVRCFEDNDIVHVNGKVDPKSDIDVINLELVFSDLDQIDKRMDKLKKGKARDSQSKLKEEAEKTALEKIQEALMDGKPARSVILTDFERDAVKHLCLLTMKPVIYVANVAESDVADPANNNYVKDVTNVASELQSGIVTISAQKNQIVVACSSTKVEYRSLALAVAEVIWIQTLLFELKNLRSTPIIFFGNLSTVALAHNPVLHAYTKHMDLDLFFVREKVAAKHLQVVYVPAINQCANVLTKALSLAILCSSVQAPSSRVSST